LTAPAPRRPRSDLPCFPIPWLYMRELGRHF